MSLGTVIGVIGIVVSAAFGIWGVFLALRKAKYPASLTFVREQVIGLFDDLARKLPNLNVRYKNNPIDSNIILVSGYTDLHNECLKGIRYMRFSTNTFLK